MTLMCAKVKIADRMNVLLVGGRVGNGGDVEGLEFSECVRRNESPGPQCLLKRLNGGQTKQRSQDQFCARTSDFPALNSTVIVKAAA